MSLKTVSQSRLTTSHQQQPTKLSVAAIRSIARTAMVSIPDLVAVLLPDGHAVGNEWTAINPRRADKHIGSFRINLRTGRWADFATTARGGDIVSLVAYVLDMSQSEAAKRVSSMIGMEVYRG